MVVRTLQVLMATDHAWPAAAAAAVELLLQRSIAESAAAVTLSKRNCLRCT
jgi:hypothetical protein